MTEQTKRYCIRNFGNDRQFDSVEETLQGLHEHYRGVSVAIHARTKTGLLRCLFVDVSGNCELYESYAREGCRRVSEDALVQACE